MRKKIIGSIIVIAAIAVGAWVFTRDNYWSSDKPYSSAEPSLPYGSGSDAASVPPANQQASPPLSANTAVKEFTVTGQDYSFMPSALSVKKGDRVKIIFKNIDGFHDFKIDEFDAATTRIRAGEQDIITFVADKAGSFEYYCSVGSHRQMGMKGTLTVAE